MVSLGGFMRKLFLYILPATVMIAPNAAVAGIASTEYVKAIVDALEVAKISENLTGHINNTENPHAVTAAQVGLGNVQNVDTTNADNLTSGTVNVARLPVGNAADTVAPGNDTRFDTISTTEPAGTPPDGRVYVWFE